MESTPAAASWALPLCLCAVAAVYLLTPSAGQRALQKLPVPPSTLPLLGNTLDLMKYQLPRLHDWFTEQCLLHGGKSWLLQALGAPPCVVVSSVETFEDVLKTQFEIFDKGERMRNIFEDVFGDGIIAVDGEKWLFQRRKLSHLFTMRAFHNTITNSVHKYVRIMGDVLEKAAASNEPFDFGNACHRMAFDVFAEIGFGLQKNTLATGEDNSFIDLLNRVGEIMERRFHQPDFLWKLKRFLRIGAEKRLLEAVEALNKEVYAIIYENLRRKNDPKYKPQQEHATKDVVSLFLDEFDQDKGQDKASAEAPSSTTGTNKEGEGPKVDIKFLRDIGLMILSAGKDTTAMTLMWIVITLNRYPHVLPKIREELRAKLPKLFTDRDYIPSVEDVEQLLYLDAVVRETLRLNPLIPLNAKEANADTTLCDGTLIKKGTRVYIPSYALGRMPSVWGPDAAEFKPERWIETDGLTGKQKLIQVSAYKFVAFHAGPRICLGMRFALFEVKVSLSYMLSKYDFTTVKNAEDYTYEIASGLEVKGPVIVNVARAPTVTVGGEKVNVNGYILAKGT